MSNNDKFSPTIGQLLYPALVLACFENIVQNGTLESRAASLFRESAYGPAQIGVEPKLNEVGEFLQQLYEKTKEDNTISDSDIKNIVSREEEDSIRSHFGEGEDRKAAKAVIDERATRIRALSLVSQIQGWFVEILKDNSERSPELKKAITKYKLQAGNERHPGLQFVHRDISKFSVDLLNLIATQELSLEDLKKCVALKYGETDLALDLLVEVQSDRARKLKARLVGSPRSKALYRAMETPPDCVSFVSRI